MSLAEHLQHRKQHLESLRSLLKEEQGLLAVGLVDGKRLAEVASEKQQHLSAIDLAERRLAERERGEATPDNRRHAAERGGCLPLWRDTNLLAREVSRLNQLNGHLIQLRLEHNQRMLNTLREAAGSHLYGPDGQARGRQGQLNSTV